ncbi:hypothetical protein [Streptomyces zagrosensis]|uniref:Uncharacterized protein n=1 Tax=Streptomyces zagrosensis TaxID=1042984 RepID=A0A7W9UZ80_9ACTN|nr:hypothetical protein [Streptomyces zagrosensis]MBB5935504.1 hypothetical protein [Streptomyces zagrosensis]
MSAPAPVQPHPDTRTSIFRGGARSTGNREQGVRPAHGGVIGAF